jgi:hypothetical protein
MLPRLHRERFGRIIIGDISSFRLIVAATFESVRLIRRYEIE